MPAVSVPGNAIPIHKKKRSKNKKRPLVNFIQEETRSHQDIPPRATSGRRPTLINTFHFLFLLSFFFFFYFSLFYTPPPPQVAFEKKRQIIIKQKKNEKERKMDHHSKSNVTPPKYGCNVIYIYRGGKKRRVYTSESICSVCVATVGLRQSRRNIVPCEKSDFFEGMTWL